MDTLGTGLYFILLTACLIQEEMRQKPNPRKVKSNIQLNQYSLLNL